MRSPKPRISTRSASLFGLLALGALVGCGEGTLEAELEPTSTEAGGGTLVDDGAGGSGLPMARPGEAPAGGAGSGPLAPGAGGGDPGDPSDPGDPEDPPGPMTPFAPADAVMLRLTATQYRKTLEDLFGANLPRTPVEPDSNPYLFYSIGAATTEVSEAGVDQYAEAAYLVSDAIGSDPARLQSVMACAPTASDDACVDAFIRGLGRRLYRRPLTEEEVAGWLSLSRDTADGDVVRGVRLLLAGMLQSPHFLYRIELGADAGDPVGHRYTAWEMASRMAFLLTDAAPDEALLDAAERGELDTDEGLEAHALRLLETDRARTATQEFFTQYLDLARLQYVDLDPADYPGFSRGLLRAMETELRLLVDDVVHRQGGDVRGLFSARRGYVNRELAALYGVDAPGATSNAFVPVVFGPEVPRAGILTSAAFLTMNAHRTETSPTLRGKYIRERVLCQEVPPPPPDIDLDLAPSEGDPPTLRERLEEHRKNPACAGCHAFIDPPGFLFEHYDSMGRYRDAVDGYPVNSTGDLDGHPLADALELAKRLESTPDVGRCITRQLYRFANGRLDTASDRAVLADLNREFEASGYDFKALLVALVLSDGFRYVAPPASAAEAP